MLFGLRSAPALPQRSVEIILSGVKRHLASVYRDGIIVNSKSITDHRVHVHTVQRILRNAVATMRLSKCVFRLYTLAKTHDSAEKAESE